MAGFVQLEVDVASEQRDKLLLRIFDAMAELKPRKIESPALEACKKFLDEFVGVREIMVSLQTRERLHALARSLLAAAQHATFRTEIFEVVIGYQELGVWPTDNGTSFWMYPAHEEHLLILAVDNMNDAAWNAMKDALLTTVLEETSRSSRSFVLKNFGDLP